jgi:hypothetical protein
MTLRQFTALATVAKHMNIPRAAQALRISQPSLSKRRSFGRKLQITIYLRNGKASN